VEHVPILGDPSFPVELFAASRPSEFEFRFNRRTSHAPTHLFQRLMEGAVRDGQQPYAALVGKKN
jgi:hypothetical protein